MEIKGYGSIKSTSSVKKRTSSSSVGSFSELLDAAGSTASAPASQISDITATSALDNLLSLQEISEEDIRRKKLVQQGKSLLDVLDGLRQQILAGVIPPRTLQELARQLSVQKQAVADPELIAIIDDIELRAAVELAKLEMAAQAAREP